MTNRTAGLTLMDLILFLYTPCPPSVLSLGAPVFFPMCFSFFALLPVPSGGGRTRTKGVDVAPRPSTPPLKTGWAGSRGLLLKVSAFQHPGEPTLPQHYGQTILLTARGKHDPPPPPPSVLAQWERPLCSPPDGHWGRAVPDVCELAQACAKFLNAGRHGREGVLFFSFFTTPLPPTPEIVSCQTSGLREYEVGPRYPFCV